MTNNWVVVNEAIRAERGRRSWSREELSTRSGVSIGTIKNLEGARRYQATPVGALQKLDRTFGWPPGRLESLLDGSEEISSESDYRREPVSDGDIATLIHNVVFDAVVSTAPDTPASRIREIEERGLELARQAGFGPRRPRQDTHTQDDAEA